MGLYEDARAARAEQAQRDEQARVAHSEEIARREQEENDLLEFRTTFAKAALESDYPSQVICRITRESRRKGLLREEVRFCRFHQLGAGWIKQFEIDADGGTLYENYIVLSDGRMFHSIREAVGNWVPQWGDAYPLKLVDRPNRDYVVIDAPSGYHLTRSSMDGPEHLSELRASDFSFRKAWLLPWLGEAIDGPLP